MSNEDSQSMGAMFNQRRAQRQQQSSGRSPQSGSGSFADIQREQQLDQNQHHRSGRRGRDPPRSRLGGGGARRGGHSRGHHGSSRDHLPVERGRICSLRENFGFIYCADRPEELFFHYSEFSQGRATDLDLGDEVEFRVGPAQTRGGREADDGKMAAYGLALLDPGTVVWDDEDEPGVRTRGRVERPAHSGGHRGDRGESEGTIRILIGNDGMEGDEAGDEAGDKEVAASSPQKKGPLARYIASEITQDEKRSASQSQQDVRGNRSTRIARGDIVEFTLVTERRSGLKKAKSIALIMSEKDRLEAEKEKNLLETATLERGVVVTLKNEFGFLRSNKQREEIYFHFSHIELPDANDEAEEGEFTLGEGQDMEFLVVDENRIGKESGGRGKGRISARQIKFLPKGTVKFQYVLARGVTGKVIEKPHPPMHSSGGRGRHGSTKSLPSMSDGLPGKVLLANPIKVVDDGAKELLGADTVTEVAFPIALSPGGTFAVDRAGSRLGVWVNEGDNLLFDVVVEMIDGVCRVESTTFLRPKSSVEADDSKCKKEGKAAVKLIETTLVGRTEGVVHVIKDNFGFIHLADRNVDAYFRLADVLPNDVNASIVHNMKRVFGDKSAKKRDDSTPQKIAAGMEVSFDFFIQAGGPKSSSGRNRGPEKENARAVRIAILPKGSIVHTKTLASGIKGTVVKEDAKQPFAGNIQLEKGVTRMSTEERHPNIAKLLDSIEADPCDVAEIVFSQLLSTHDNKVFNDMISSRKGRLELDYIPTAGDETNPGRLRITKVQRGQDLEEVTEDVDERIEDSAEAAASDGAQVEKEKKKKAKVSKPKVISIKTLRYDKNSLPQDEMHDPPGLKDIVVCDVVQSRRTGTVSAVNVKIVERKAIERGQRLVGSEGGDSIGPESGSGIVIELLESRGFGFISVLDEHAAKREMIFFHLRDVLPSTSDEDDAENAQADQEVTASEPEDSSTKAKKKGGTATIRKGDEVKFGIEFSKKTSKRTAKNVQVLPPGTLNISTKADKNACKGYILMEPSYTSLENTPTRKATGTAAKVAAGSRWAAVDLDKDEGASGSGSEIMERGVILLLEDPAGLFSSKVVADVEDMEKVKSSEDAVPLPDVDAEEGDEVKEAVEEGDCNAGGGTKGKGKAPPPTLLSAVGTHLSYANAAVALRGAGATGASSASADARSGPKRGDLVSFVRAKKSGGGGAATVPGAARDVRVVEPRAATAVRGQLVDVNVSPEVDQATFVAATTGQERYSILPSKDVVSCVSSLLKEGEMVEGILHDGDIYGVCRTKDLYLSSKSNGGSRRGGLGGGVGGSGLKERPRLNLTVKKGLGGQIMAQSGMAKGPDGTQGFPPGWTQRASSYATSSDEEEEEGGEEVGAEMELADITEKVASTVLIAGTEGGQQQI